MVDQVFPVVKATHDCNSSDAHNNAASTILDRTAVEPWMEYSGSLLLRGDRLGALPWFRSKGCFVLGLF
jgi:hypothetical protein